MMAAIDRVKSEVAESRSIMQSAAALLTRLAQMIRDAVNDPAELNALADELDAQQQELAAAIVANTPAENNTEPTE